MKPALTKEEWAGADEHTEGAIAQTALRFAEWAMPWMFADRGGDARHALAALALHGQPFGFGREDVRLLREADLDSFRDESGAVQDEHPQRAKLSALADRIEALLPPEGTP